MVMPDLVLVVWFRSVRVTDGAETWGWGVNGMLFGF